MSIKTRKIKLIPVGETSQDRTKIYNYIKKIGSDLTSAGNEVIRLHICNQYEIDKLKTNHNVTKGEAIKILQNTLGTSIRNSGYQFLSKFDYIASSIRSGFNSIIYKTISNNFHDILNGKMSVPSFRKTNINIPLLAHNDKETGVSNTLYTINDDVFITFPQSISETKINGKISLKLFFGKDRSNNKIIVNRILNGEYKLSDSLIQINDDELFLLLTYSQPNTVNPNIDPNKIMGIDLGINRPVSIYISNQKHQPRQINIGLKIQHDRLKLSNHRRSIQQSLKYSKGGHGRNKKLNTLQNLEKKEKNWAITINHLISSEVIKIAKEHNVGVIKMEDLTGITKNKKDYFMKTWSYDKLQNFIKYKAEHEGIKVEFVDPKNTSITCPTCNTIDPNNRSDIDKTIFKCQNFLCDDFDKIKDADVIGAINISDSFGHDEKPKSKKGRLKKYIKQQNTSLSETL